MLSKSRSYITFICVHTYVYTYIRTTKAQLDTYVGYTLLNIHTKRIHWIHTYTYVGSTLLNIHIYIHTYIHTKHMHVDTNIYVRTYIHHLNVQRRQSHNRQTLVHTCTVERVKSHPILTNQIYARLFVMINHVYSIEHLSLCVCTLTHPSRSTELVQRLWRLWEGGSLSSLVSFCRFL